jgi:hypothetical protein
MVMFSFPKQMVRFSFREKAAQPDDFGNDVYTDSYEDHRVIVEPDSTDDQPEPHENHDRATVVMYTGKSLSKSLQNVTFEVLTGPMAGRLFKVVGDPTAYSVSLMGYDREIRAAEVYRGEN